MGFAEEAYAWQEACTPMPGQPSIDANGDWNCGPLSRNDLLVMCKTVVRESNHPAPPMDPGPKNLLEYLGLDWDMRSRILSQTCEAWDLIRTSEPEVCYGEIQPGWADDDPAPAATVLQASICPTSGKELPMCRLFSRADSYVADPHVVSGSLKKITAQKTIYRFDDFDEKPGYTMSVVDGIFGDEKLKEEMATGLYHDVPR